MTVAVIGLESMPNVYFSDVVVDENELTAKLTMKDFVDNPIWSTSDILRGQLNIKVLTLCYNDGDDAQKLSEELKEGMTSIHDISGYPVRVLSCQEYLAEETLVTGDINNFYYDYKITSEDIDLSKDNIYLFAIAFADLTAMNLNYATYKYLDGPMVSEAARDNGRVPARGTLFRLDDGTIWSGPVHEHEGGYMEGSFHRSQPHRDLTEQEVEAKVSDFFLSIAIDENMNEDVTAPDTPTYDLGLVSEGLIAPQFEEFYHFQQELDTSIVVIDTSNLALNELQSARELFNTNQQYFYELMKSFYIPQFEIRKAPLKSRLDFLDIGSRNWTYDSDNESILIRTNMVDGKFEERFEMRFFTDQFNVNPNNLVESTTNRFDINTISTFESSKKIGYIKELPSNELFLHNLLVVDEEYFSDDSEDYKLKLNIDFVDSFKIELENTKTEMLTLISNLTETYNALIGRLDKQRVINFFLGNGILLDQDLKFVRIESQSSFDDSIFSRLSSTLNKMLLALLSDNQVISGVISTVIQNLYVNNVSKENYNLVVSFLNNLTERFITKYNLTTTNNKSALQNYSISRVEKEIQKVIEVNRVKQGSFSFFNKEDGQKVITISELETRANEEYSKFFNRNISSREITNISGDIDSTSAQQMVDFETAKFIFYTPVSYRIGDQVLDLSQADISIFDEKKHDTITNNMFAVNSQPSRRRRSGGPKLRQTIGNLARRSKKRLLTTIATGTPFKSETTDTEDLKFENVEDYIGSDSPFLSINLGTRRKDIEPDPVPSTLIKKSFAQDRKINNFETISLDNESSALLKNKNSIDFSRLPLQFRALVLSNYGLSRFSFALEEDQLLQNPKFSTAINNIFNRVRIANYLDSFELNEVGLRIMNSPIYLPLSQEAIDSGRTLMIKMDKFKNGILQVEGQDNTPATNTFLVVEGTITPASNTPDPFEIEVTDREQKEFSTTNILRQNDKRQELTSFVSDEQLRRAPVSPASNPTTALRPTQTSRRPSSQSTPTTRRRTSSGTTRRAVTTRTGGGSGGGGY